MSSRPTAVPPGAEEGQSARVNEGTQRPPWFMPAVVFAAITVLGVAIGLGVGLTGSGSGLDAGAGGVSIDGYEDGPGDSPSDIAAEDGTWTVMIYADADDEVLEEDMVFDLNEAELVGSSDKVKVVAQIDRYAGGYAGDMDVTTARRYLLAQDSDLYTLNSSVVDDLGEIDMGDPQTLYDFATWAIETYPAERYVLIMSNHGSGWAGGWTDDQPLEGSGLGMPQIDGTLAAIVSDTGIGAFELVGFDACLMAQAEVFSAIAPHARFAVASEETEPSLGWSYAGFLGALADDTGMSGAELGEAIVDSYIDQDVRITDEGARRSLVEGEISAEEVIEVLGRSSTLSAVDLSKMRDLDEALNELVVALADTDQSVVAEARAYAQSYASLFSSDDPNEQLPPSFIDLGNFVDLLGELTDDEDVISAGRYVKEALAEAVVAERHGEERPGSSGMTIYFPASTEYAGTFAGYVIDYPSSVGRFATASLWDDFLTFHYTGEAFDPSAADLSVVTPALASLSDFSKAVEQSAPDEGALVVGPGSGGVSIEPLTTSTDTLTARETVALSTEIGGANIAYVYYYIAYYWEEDGSFLSADAGFVEPGEVKEVNGVYYPDWGDGSPVMVEQYWEPTVFFLSDGNEANDEFAFFEPIDYGAEVAGDVYAVMGTYTFADTGTQIDAELEFNGEGEMLSVWGYSADQSTGVGTWHELTPRPGDTFTITDVYLEFDENPDGEFVEYEGGTMTFGEEPFMVQPYEAPPGEYLIGFGVEDLDGNVTWEFANVTVVE